MTQRIIAAGTLADIAGKIKAEGRQENAFGEPAATRLSTVVAPLTIACQDEDADVRQEALRALGAIGSPQSASYILAALKDDSDMVFFSGSQAAAAMKLTEVLDIYLEMFEGDLPDDYDIRLSSAITCMGELGDKRATGFLHRCAGSAYWGTKVEAAQALLALGDASSWDLLEQALGDRDSDWVYYCRASIARAVAKSGDPRAVDLLLEALEGIDVDYTCDEYLLESLIESLARIGDPRAIEPIRKWQHYEFEHRENVVEEALGKLEVGSKG